VAPVVIGRDHLDCGSVASPYRETESMQDGSDAIADWPLLNALVNTASGASWVSIHHGGGVGIGRSIHAGQVCVADGTPLAGAKLERVLTNDPGMGVLRPADAGYDEASQVASDRGVRIPMHELPSVATAGPGRRVRHRPATGSVTQPPAERRIGFSVPPARRSPRRQVSRRPIGTTPGPPLMPPEASALLACAPPARRPAREAMQ
jgi:hypothetical protein